MELKITKGEWTIVDSTDKSLSVWASESECITTINYDFWDPKYQDELKANAHLIAAAPDMYKALERVKQGHLNLCELNIVPDRYQKDAYKIVNEIDELLKKARGE